MPLVDHVLHPHKLELNRPVSLRAASPLSLSCVFALQHLPSPPAGTGSLPPFSLHCAVFPAQGSARDIPCPPTSRTHLKTRQGTTERGRCCPGSLLCHPPLPAAAIQLCFLPRLPIIILSLSPDRPACALAMRTFLCLGNIKHALQAQITPEQTPLASLPSAVVLGMAQRSV